MLIRKTTTPIVLSLLLLLCLTSCNNKAYILKTNILLDGVIAGPSEIKIENGESVEFAVKLKDVNYIRYTLSENQQQVDITAQIIFRQGNFVNTNTLPSFSILADGQEASMEYKAEENAPNVHWTVSAKPS